MQPRMLRASSAAASACLPTDDASMQAPTFLRLSPLEAREATANRTLNDINGVAHASTHVRPESCLLLLRGRDHRCHLVNRKLVEVTDPCQKPLGIGGGLNLSDQYTRQIRRQLQRRAMRDSVRLTQHAAGKLFVTRSELHASHRQQKSRRVVRPYIARY